jgi:hypothetical protein
MATKYKTLGQALPAANTSVDLYTVPAGNSAVISTLNICNLTQSNVTFRASIRVAGAAANNKQFIAYDIPIPGQDATSLTLGIAMDATDVLTVYSYQGNVAFNAFGAEIY